MKPKKRWKELRKILAKVLRISPDILDFLSNYDIMLASVSGSSVRDISHKFGISRESVKKILESSIGNTCDGWSGFETSSVINPYFVFKELTQELDRIPTEGEFSDYMQRLTGDAYYSEHTFEKVYRIILSFCTLRVRYLYKYRKEDHANYINRHLKEVT